MNTQLDRLLGDFCQEALVMNFRPTTVRWWRESMRMFVSHFGDDVVVHVDDVTHERLRSYLYEKRLAGWTADTFSNRYRALKAFLKWCVQHGHLASNPIDGIERPRLEKKLPKRISADDAVRVLDYAFHGPVGYRFQRSRDRGVLAVMLYAGLRTSEVLNLKLGHVDIANRTLFVQCGKGAKDRMVPMNATLARHLGEYLSERTRLEKRSDYFFTTLRGDRQFTYSGLKRVINRVKAGTGVSFSAHRLRHTFATLMVEGGCDLFSLQQMMGHSDIKTTTIYLSATARMLQAQIAKHPLSQLAPRDAAREMRGPDVRTDSA